MSKLNIGVVGGGIAGLSTAFRLAQLGHQTTIYDPDHTNSASYAAAGMLAPATEVDFSEITLLRFMELANSLWPAFASDIEQLSGSSIELRSEGTVAIGFDRNDAEELARLSNFQEELGIKVEKLTRNRLKELEPNISPMVAYASLIKSDTQVHNRKLLNSLRVALTRLGSKFEQSKIQRLSEMSPSSFSISVANGNYTYFDAILLAPGSSLDSIEGLPSEIAGSIRPIKGQIIRVNCQGSPIISHVVRSNIRNQKVYMVPRLNGEIVIGASQEEAGFDETAKSRFIAELLSNAISIVPEIGETHFAEHLVRFRPGTKDNAPIIGKYRDSNLFVSLGHFRHGILLSAAISKYLASLIVGDTISREIVPFNLERIFTDVN